MNLLLVFVSGAVFGAILVLIISHLYQKKNKALAQQLVSQAQAEKTQELEILLSRVRDSFGSLSFEALKKNTDEFLKLANEVLSRQTQMGQKELEGKKQLIDQTLEGIKTDLVKFRELITDFEKERSVKFGQLDNQLRLALEQTTRLQETTNQLRQALSNTRARGQWGERMAEDILRLMGFVEGINYKKQVSSEGGQSRPDFTFFLPQGRKINMDVKFPLDNYLRYLEATSDWEKEDYKQRFLKDTQARIKEVTSRNYIDLEDNTLDYVLIFIPNEQVYAFINESDPTLLDEALKKKVILCSPITLYAVLAIIHQAMENFNLQNTAGQILNLLESFYKQWQAFVKSLERVGKKIDEAQAEFQILNSTRKNQLEKPLRQIETIKKQVEPEKLETGVIEAEAELLENMENEEKDEKEESSAFKSEED
ncbi:MAG TPA: DNA recombination protein RmuC [Candidatus Saccharicenans sp.]|nr:DNA recombination protein RmuC [Candidatus Saccharicenans sp.]HUM79746.1 DNA recombination protein RmuC [Candidatus Saccharicenans sp.]